MTLELLPAQELGFQVNANIPSLRVLTPLLELYEVSTYEELNSGHSE